MKTNNANTATTPLTTEQIDLLAANIDSLSESEAALLLAKLGFPFKECAWNNLVIYFVPS